MHDKIFINAKDFFSMFNLVKRPYLLLSLTAILVLVASFFAPDRTLDLHMNDTYFVIAVTHVCWSVIILLFFFWILYLLTEPLLFSRFLMWTHILLTVVASLVLLIIAFYADRYYREGFAGMPRRYYDYSNREAFISYISYDQLARNVLIVILLFVSGIITYLTNLAVGITRKILRRA